MSVNLFITLITILSLSNTILTEAVKRAFTITKPTLVAAVLAMFVGQGGTSAAYILMDVAFNPKSIVALVLMAPIIQVGSTIGYDKIVEIVKQILGQGK